MPEEQPVNPVHPQPVKYIRVSIHGSNYIFFARYNSVEQYMRGKNYKWKECKRIGGSKVMGTEI